MLAAATVSQATVSFVNFGLPAIGPELGSEYGLTLAELGAVLAAGLLGSGLALIAAGAAVDRFGPRLSTVAGTALGALGLSVAAVVDSVGPLIAALAVFGVGTAVVPIAGTSALFRVYPAPRRAWALGVRQMAVPLGGTVAAVAMPLLVRAGGVGLAFAVAAGLVATMGCVFALISEEGSRSARPQVPRPFRTIVRAQGMLRLLVVAALYIIVLQAVLAYTVPAVRAAGLSALVASTAYLGINVSAMAARVLWGKVADRQGGGRRARTLVEVGLVAAAGALVFTVALHAGPAAVVVAAVVFGFGALGWNGIVYVSAGELASPELAGRSVAVAATVVFLVSAVCTPVLGALAAQAGWDAFWISTSLLALLGALIAVRLVAPVRPDA